jgi:hypothetical protein
MVNSVLENDCLEEEMLRFSRRLQQVFHGFGLSCLAGAVILQVLVFFDIGWQGYFFAVENNPLILWAEVALSGFTATYFVYMYLRYIRSLSR